MTVPEQTDAQRLDKIVTNINVLIADCEETIRAIPSQAAAMSLLIQLLKKLLG